MSYFFSSDFVCVVTAIAKKKDKEQTRVKTDLGSKKDDCNIQNKINSSKTLSAAGKILALAAKKALADQNAPVLVDGKAPED